MTTHHEFSPSALPRLYACPGSHKLSLSAEPTPPGPDAAEGTMLHKAVYDRVTYDGLDGEQREAVDFARQYLELEPWADTHHELHVAVMDGMDLLTAGTADVVQVDRSGGRGRVVDWKFGRIEVEDAADNLQLAAYSLGAAQRWGLRAVGAVVVQPRLRKVGAPHGFTAWDAILATIRKVIQDCHRPGLVLCSGPHCRYCPAARDCPELVREATAMIEGHSSEVADPAGMVPFLDAADRAAILAKRLAEFVDRVRHNAVKLATERGDIPGWVVTEGRARRSIPDLSKAFATLAAAPANVTADEFVSACKASVPDLEDLVAAKLAEKHGVSVAAGRRQFAAIMAALIETTRGEKTIKRIKA